MTYSAIVAGITYLTMGLIAGLDEVFDAVALIPGKVPGVLLILSLASYSARLIRWISFLRPLHPEIPLRDHAGIYFRDLPLP